MKLKALSILHKVTGATSDVGKNVGRAIYDLNLNLNLNLNRVWCIAHRLHLCITNGFGFWVVKKEDDQNNAPTSQ